MFLTDVGLMVRIRLLLLTQVVTPLNNDSASILPSVAVRWLGALSSRFPTMLLWVWNIPSAPHASRKSARCDVLRHHVDVWNREMTTSHLDVNSRARRRVAASSRFPRRQNELLSTARKPRRRVSDSGSAHYWFNLNLIYRGNKLHVILD